MAPLTEAEEQVLAQGLLDQLSRTAYACSAVTKLSGGTANFVYRGDLLQPLPSDTSPAPVNTVIIKISTAFSAINRDFPLGITRCIFEESMLRALAGFPHTITTPTGHTQVKAPQTHFFDKETHTQVLEDFPDTTDLTTILQSSDLDRILPGSSPESVGRALGSWLRLFHSWASAPAQSTLLAQVGPNQAMRQLKCLVTYDSFIEILERHPETIEGYKDTLEDVRAAMKQEFERPIFEGDEARGFIHGDFWAGNVLLPNGPWHESKELSQKLNKLFIIDWENAQFGHRAVDVGGMLADLYERNHFKDVAASIFVMNGFMDGYGPFSDEFAYRVAIHAGVHLICWYYRRDRNSPLPYPLPKVLAALTLGRDLILKAWAKDKKWLQTTVLGPLFAGNSSA
ncbi:kinase-like domain-containing protein [Nemania abortiva]|nr:kinase-like domain-containing protein [Nemania abortiva]